MFSFLLKRRPRPIVKERKEHNISRKDIAPEALKVLYRLHDSGNLAYLVGGGVRDLLLGRRPKDFDVGTDASPNEIRRLFRRCFLVGRRFRLAHVIVGDKTIETATFRKQPDHDPVSDEHGLYQTDDNTFGSPEDDAYRRDFTINGLFYDIATFRVIDYVGGLKDLERRLVRSIGDPAIRFREDPVRMMRAVRFAAKLDFEIDPGDLRAIAKYHSEIRKASVPRLCEEIFRLFVDGKTERCFRILYKTGLLPDLLPQISDYLKRSGADRSPLWIALQGLDRIATDGRPISNALRLAILYYPLYLDLLARATAAQPSKRPNHRQCAFQALEVSARLYNMPKSAWMNAALLIDQLGRLTRKPNPDDSFTQRLLRNPRLPVLCDLAEALAQLPETPTLEDANAWKRLIPGTVPEDNLGAAPAPERPPRRSRRRRRRPKRQPDAPVDTQELE
ncbi:MAG: polynucleotide adenylyltransferase PcnB [Kiritimatiellia bacterium]